MSEWIVSQNQYGFDVLEVTKRTEKQVIAKDGRHKYVRHIPLHQVLAFLPEDRAWAMRERLVSSIALETEERHKATLRHLERVERIKAEFSK